jgi:nicotinamidase-related amidase
MNQAKTLIEMSGNQIPFNAKSAAVVLIDFQNEYTEGKLPLYKVADAISETAKLVAWARKNELPVVHVLHQGSAGGIFDPATFAGKVIPQVKPIPGEAVVNKQYPNSFTETELEKILKSTGKKSIIFAGLMTHMCLEATVRAAFDHGYTSLVLADATTTRDLPTRNGGVVKAEVLKEASLAALADLVAVVDKGVAELESKYVSH